jgi:hypothetical protein
MIALFGWLIYDKADFPPGASQITIPTAGLIAPQTGYGNPFFCRIQSHTFGSRPSRRPNQDTAA